MTLDCLEREFFENKTRTSVRFLEKKIAIVYDHYQGRRAMYLKSQVKVLEMTASHAYVIREKILEKLAWNIIQIVQYNTGMPTIS